MGREKGICVVVVADAVEICWVVIVVDQVEAVNRSRRRSGRESTGILVQSLVVLAGGIVVQILVLVGEEQRCCHLERGTAGRGCCSWYCCGGGCC
jgi:uncharacterized membrane protein